MGRASDAEELTSLNCPGNSFVAFNQNGFRYQLIYKPDARRWDDEGRSPEHRRQGRRLVWSGNWEQRGRTSSRSP